jgi:hypothetical protein
MGDVGLAAMHRKARMPLWQNGALFHVANRYPRKHHAPKVDRLAGILKRGLVAPARCPDGLVRSDLNLLVTGCSVAYDQLVFLHSFGSASHIYTICERGRFAVFVDSTLPVLTPEDMGLDWVVLCQDEVYVRDGIAAGKVVSVAVHPEDADAVMRELSGEFQRLGIPLCDYDGTILWPPAGGGTTSAKRRHRGKRRAPLD